MYGLHIIWHRDRLITEAFLYRIDGLCDSVERSRQSSGQYDSQCQDCHHHDHFQNVRLTIQHFLGIYDTVIGNAGQHNAPDGIRIPFSVFVRSVCRGIHDGSGHFYVTVLRVIMGNVFPLKTFDDLLGNDGLSFTDAVGIFFHLEILVDDHNAAFIQIGQHLQFRIDDFSGIAGVLSDTMAA